MDHINSFDEINNKLNDVFLFISHISIKDIFVKMPTIIIFAFVCERKLGRFF